MKLHHDRNAFLTLIQQVGENSGYRLDVLEKDYYVVLMLKELSIKQQVGLKAFFKGGTAVYKIFEKMNRFSEDIDLTVNTVGLSSKQHQRHLKSAAKDYNSLKFSNQEKPQRSSRTCLFEYESLFDIDVEDQLQRYGKVKIEATTFTKSEPVEKHRISPILYTLSNEPFRDILKTQYDVEPFELETLTLPRIFIDKVFALENRLRKEEFFDAAKHAYDLYQLIISTAVKEAVLDRNLLNELIEIQQSEEQERLNSSIRDLKLKDFEFDNLIKTKMEFKRYFEEMQRVYVFNETDRIDFESLSRVLDEIHSYIVTFQ